MKDTQIIYPSTATTATHTVEFSTPTKGGVFVINATAETATASVTFKIQGVDPVSGATWDILTSAAVEAVGTTTLKVYPGLTAAANTVVSDVLPEACNVVCTHADADSLTYSIGFIGID